MEKLDSVLPGEAREYLTFRLGAEEYGIEILKIREIRSFEPVTRIAGAPPYIRGVFDLRGAIVPLVDLRRKIMPDSVGPDEFAAVIILAVGGCVVGAVVDAVSDVLALEADQIKAPPLFHAMLDTRYITGLGRVESNEGTRLLILVDIEKFMSSDDIAVIARAAAA
jgi:purine-binding chemotaxis protein CheW